MQLCSGSVSVIILLCRNQALGFTCVLHPVLSGAADARGMATERVEAPGAALSHPPAHPSAQFWGLPALLVSPAGKAEQFHTSHWGLQVKTPWGMLRGMLCIVGVGAVVHQGCGPGQPLAPSWRNSLLGEEPGAHLGVPCLA